MRLPTTPVTTLQRALRDEVRHNNPAGRVVVAVDGADAHGTATFADGFAAVFAEADTAVFRASIDGFRRPRTERNTDGDTEEGLYRDGFDYSTFRRVLVEPFRDGAQTSATTGFQLAAFDVDRDAPRESEWVTAPRDAVLIVDGPFLLRPELRGVWNWSVWLEATPAPQWHPVLDLYRRDARPTAAASALVDDSDPQHPFRAYQDFC